ncbi:uncharacterized protein LAESUDRAFT_691537 [Laetiporus sulphureus 93-53]|uniref:Fido domain-containing protein n=1 Tax=Laetiporus sulphureus 93-53 TaxID=1314785 RepID=A0A165HWA0_9APHY|nr:uncharacterized protein LAESUDRAFT_691537 [Laetiporus sulphureus 93-53]KZT12274.1 hypothetical protein LAESUDRAFT_691537 [Laetiporus sulphureus 93-53]
MSAHAARLARLFTPEYACRINAQIVHPAKSGVVKPNELESAFSRPLDVSIYKPNQPATYLAATLSYGIIKGHPFLDGNKRTALFLANEYLRAQGLPGLADAVHEGLAKIADQHINVAAGKVDVEGLAKAIGSRG